MILGAIIGIAVYFGVDKYKGKPIDFYPKSTTVQCYYTFQL